MSAFDKAGIPDLSETTLRVDPIERAYTIPSTWYTHPGFLQLEKEAVFSQTWQYVGHAAQVQAPGDYAIAAIADNPIIVVRGKENALRAFYNVCRHRGGPLATCSGHTPHVLQCHYHGWTYLLDGSLRGVTDFDRVELFDKKDYGLVPVNVCHWQGMIFVNLADSPGPLQDFVAGIPERISPMKLDAKKFHRRVSYTVRCNWKVYVDNYLEGYHLPIVHPGLTKMLDYQKYTTETFRHYSLQHSPFSGEENVYTAGDGNAFYYYVFPNFTMNILPGRLQTNLIVPLTHDLTTVHFDYYYDDIASPSAQKMIESDIAGADAIQQEDIEICELVQKGLMSKAYRQGRFSVKREEGVYHFQNLLKEAFHKA